MKVGWAGVKDREFAGTVTNQEKDAKLVICICKMSYGLENGLERMQGITDEAGRCWRNVGQRKLNQ